MNDVREAWLLSAIAELRPRFEAIEFPLPDRVRVSVGWSKRAKKGSVGWCWVGKADGEQVNQIFISPELPDPTRVLPALLHELIHAADDCTNGHKGPFVKAFLALGFTGKATACTPGEDLARDLHALAEKLGPFPHAALTPGERSSAPKAQTNRHLKITCTNCEYTVRASQKCIDIGLPTCPCGSEMEVTT